jgi:aminoglycoside phosphotransferase
VRGFSISSNGKSPAIDVLRTAAPARDLRRLHKLDELACGLTRSRAHALNVEREFADVLEIYPGRLIRGE